MALIQSYSGMVFSEALIECRLLHGKIQKERDADTEKNICVH